MFHKNIKILSFASLFVYILLAAPLLSQASGGQLEAKVKAAYIYNFTIFTDWDTEKNESLTEPINICVFGNDPITVFLEELSGRTVKGRPLKILDLKEINPTTGCHVLFISKTKEEQLPVIIQKLHGTNVLTVSDIYRFSQKGGVIGFVTERERVKIEINLQAANKAGLKLSAKLLEVAKIVK